MYVAVACRERQSTRHNGLWGLVDVDVHDSFMQVSHQRAQERRSHRREGEQVQVRRMRGRRVTHDSYSNLRVTLKWRKICQKSEIIPEFEEMSELRSQKSDMFAEFEEM